MFPQESGRFNIEDVLDFIAPVDEDEAQEELAHIIEVELSLSAERN